MSNQSISYSRHLVLRAIRALLEAAQCITDSPVIVASIPNYDLYLCPGLSHAYNILIPYVVANPTVCRINLYTAVSVVDAVTDPENILCNRLQKMF